MRVYAMKSIRNCKVTCTECGIEFMVRKTEVNRGNGKFCSLACAARHNNRTNQEIRGIQCKTCGKRSLTIRSNTLYCSVRCKNAYFNGKRAYSNKKIIAIRPCEICGWNNATRDVHHIIPKKDNGTDDLINLISLCPNCHRLVHSNLISQEQLQLAVNKRTISSSDTVISEQDANVVIKET